MGKAQGKNSSENLEAGYWPWDIMTRKTSGIQILLSKHKRARGTQQNQEWGGGQGTADKHQQVPRALKTLNTAKTVPILVSPTQRTLTAIL